MTREVYDKFPAGGPRGSWPAEERASELREQGQPATVVMDMRTDQFLVVSEGAAV